MAREREDDFDTFLKKALFDPDESVRKSLQPDTREEARSDRADRAEELRASLRRLEKRDAERESSARSAREAADKAQTRDSAREALAERVRARARELPGTTREAIAAWHGDARRELEAGPAPPLGRDGRDSLERLRQHRLRESSEATTRLGESSRMDRLGREIAALETEPNAGSPLRASPRGFERARRERDDGARPLSAHRSRSHEAPNWRGTASPALDRRIFADRDQRARAQRERRWGLEDASGRVPRRERSSERWQERPPSPYRVRSPPRQYSWERDLAHDDLRASSFDAQQIRDLGRDGYSAREEVEKHNLRQRVDRLADGVARAHNVLADHELRHADDHQAMGCAVRALQEDVVELRELIRERDKATERTLADFRAYLEAQARRTDSGLLHLQAAMDGLGGKVETLHRGLGALEHEVLA